MIRWEEPGPTRHGSCRRWEEEAGRGWTYRAGRKAKRGESRDNYFSQFVTRANIPPFVVSGLPEILIENKEKQTICGLHVSVIVCNVNYRNFNIKSVHGMIK